MLEPVGLWATVVSYYCASDGRDRVAHRWICRGTGVERSLALSDKAIAGEKGTVIFVFFGFNVEK